MLPSGLYYFRCPSHVHCCQTGKFCSQAPAISAGLRREAKTELLGDVGASLTSIFLLTLVGDTDLPMEHDHQVGVPDSRNISDVARSLP